MKRTLLLAALALACVLPTTAQEWATARIDKSPRHREFVKIKQGTREIEAFVVYPEVSTKATAVLLIHEIFGLSEWAKLAADEFAEAGYIAIIPDLLSGKGTNGGGTAAMASTAVGAAIRDLPPAQVTADLDAIAAYVTKLPAANGKLVVAGFCWGGTETFRYATNNKETKAALVFYGSGPTAAADIAKITAPVYGFYGGNDARINMTIPGSTELMKTATKKYEPVTYEGAGHGFMRAGDDPAGNEANKKAREDSWKRIKEILKAI